MPDLAKLPPGDFGAHLLEPGALVPADGLPELGGSAAAYGVNVGVTAASARRVAQAFGISGEPTADGSIWRVDGEDLYLTIQASGEWAVVAQQGRPASSPADLPSQESAKRTALDLLAAIGVDVDVEQADTDVEEHIGGAGQIGWDVMVEPRLDGVPAPGLATSVTVGPEGKPLGATGILAEPVRLGDYPLLDTRAAAERYHERAELGTAGEVVLNDAEIVLRREFADPETYGDPPALFLVPSYRFNPDDSLSSLQVVAVIDELLTGT